MEDCQDDRDDNEDDIEGDHEQSPPHSPESRHSAASMHDSEDLWNDLFKVSLRPRTSTSGAVDAPKWKFQETGDSVTLGRNLHLCLYSPCPADL